MKWICVVLLAFFTLALSINVDKCLKEYYKCRDENGPQNKTCIKEKESGRFYEIDDKCHTDCANCLCEDCIEEADESECNNENDDPEDIDTGIDKCIEQEKNCAAKEDGAKGVCLKDNDGNYFEAEDDCHFDALNCMCSNCTEKADESNCSQSNDGSDGN